MITDSEFKTFSINFYNNHPKDENILFASVTASALYLFVQKCWEYLSQKDPQQTETLLFFHVHFRLNGKVIKSA